MLKQTFYYCIIFLLYIENFYGQSDVVPKIQSPNVAALETYGEVPVNLFTGTPNISIPIHTVMAGTINLPIKLSYHPAAVKPNQHPGWVGLGWNLESFGTITRKVNGVLDELGGITSLGVVVPYYPNETSTSGTSGAAMVASDTNWYTPAQMNEYTNISNDDIYIPDVQADEFYFNCFGHSGKFYYSGSAGWVVDSEENIKIDMDGFLSPADIINCINSYQPSSTPLGVNDQDYQSRMFMGFTLTFPDGTKYIFGGSDAVEYSSGYGAAPFGGATLDTWLLKKVIDIYGNTVEFQYTRDYPNCNLYGTFTNEYYNCQSISNGPGSYSSGSASSFAPINFTYLSGKYIFPMYLNKIVTNTETVEFGNTEATNIKRYTALQFNKWNPQDPYLTLIDKNTANLKWKKLDYLRVKPNNSTTYVKSYTFAYSSAADQRLTLTGLAQTNGGPNVKFYSFYYNAISSLPNYGGNFTDHWGYYNGVDLTNAAPSQIYTKKQTSSSATTIGLLSKIRYPAGGYTEFTWEANNYSKIVAPNRISLTAVTGYAGGARIKQISNYAVTGVLSDQKTYYYVTGFAPSNPSALPSSGILNGTPQYSFASSAPRSSSGGSLNVSYGAVYLNSIANYSYSGGSHIGYNEVTEVNGDGSYTRHFFTNYGPDLNGISHYDQAPLGTLGWIQGEDAYMPFSSLETERGKEVGTYDYKSTGTLVNKRIVTFRNDAARFNDFARQIIYTGSYSCAQYDALKFMAAYKNFKYVYYPIKNEETRYDTAGSNPIVTTDNLAYNSKNQLISLTSSTSTTGETTGIKYYYPNDLSTEIWMSSLINANRIASPVAVETYRNNEKLSGKKTVFANDATTGYITLPKYEYSGKFPNTFPNLISPPVGQLEKRITYTKYGTNDNGTGNGKILEYAKEGNTPVSFIWGYKQSYPIAVIEGLSYSNIPLSLVSYVQSASDTDNDTGPTGANESELRYRLNYMRNQLLAANSLLKINTYTYDYIAGLTSSTDPKVKTTYYDYSALLYLKNIKDEDGNILEEYQYQYNMNQ